MSNSPAERRALYILVAFTVAYLSYVVFSVIVHPYDPVEWGPQ